jgi:hypothetical protein
MITGKTIGQSTQVWCQKYQEPGGAGFTLNISEPEFMLFLIHRCLSGIQYFKNARLCKLALHSFPNFHV